MIFPVCLDYDYDGEYLKPVMTLRINPVWIGQMFFPIQNRPLVVYPIFLFSHPVNPWTLTFQVSILGHFGFLFVHHFNRISILGHFGFRNSTEFSSLHLTPTGFWLCFHQKRSKTVISRTTTKFYKKNIFGKM